MNGVDPNPVTICVGQQQEFNAEGENLEGVEWSTEPEGSPPMGEGVSFQTQWATPGHKSVTASCCGTSVHAEVTVVAVAKLIIDGSEPEDEGPASLCLGESITLRAQPSPADAAFRKGSPIWEIGTRPEDSELVDPAAGSATAEITPDVAGTYAIKAFCGTSSKTFTLHALQVTFAPDPIRVGYGLRGGRRISLRPTRYATATVVPAASAADITFRLAGAGAERVRLGNPRDLPPGTLRFAVTGLEATPADQESGDTTIEAVLNGKVCGQMQAIVVIPTSIQRPFDEEDGPPTLTGNLLAHRRTRPAFPDLRPNEVARITLYGHNLTITVVDQFGDPLDELYEREMVRESLSNPDEETATWFNINQFLDAEGRYTDPVGGYGRMWPNLDRIHPLHKHLRDAWKAGPPPSAPFPVGNFGQDIRVQVAGHELTPIPAISGRRVSLTTPPNQVEIIWPTPNDNEN